MDYYAKNIEELKRVNAKLAERLEGVSPEGSIEVRMSRRGLATFFYRAEDKPRILFHSLFDPVKEAFNLLADRDLSDTQVIFVLGMGFGYLVDQLRKSAQINGTICIIEPSLEIFKSALTHGDLSEILSNPRILLFVDPDPQKMIDAIAPHLISGLYKTEIIYLSAYRRVFEGYFTRVLDFINTVTSRKLCDYNAIDELAPYWESNSLTNLPDALKSVPLSVIFKSFKDRTGVIVAAGPSLDKNIGQLKKFQSKAVIISVGTSLRPLVNNGIKPDIVVVLDASDIVLKQLEGITDTSGMWLFAEICLSPKIVSMFYPRVFFFDSMANPFLSYMLGKETAEKMYLESGGSVANCALDLAVKLGLNPIVFVGQDLCLENDRSHAKGTMHEDKRYNIGPDDINYMKAIGNYEDKVVTFRYFYIFLRWMEGYIRRFPDIAFINATAGGARIEGARLMTLDEVFDGFVKNAPFDTGPIFKQSLGKIRPVLDAGYIRKAKKALRELKALDGSLKKGESVLADAAAYIKNEKDFSPKQEKRIFAATQGYFYELFRYKTLSLLDYRIKNDIESMRIAVETNRIKAKGHSEVILRMSDVLKKLRASLQLVRQSFYSMLVSCGIRRFFIL